MATVSFTVNGTVVRARTDHPHLLAALREELDITSPKDGCSPSGQCGACVVLVDGKAIQSCLVDMQKVVGTQVTTLEGFNPGERDRLASAFAAAGALQCGFCTPGILVRTKALFIIIFCLFHPFENAGVFLTGKSCPKCITKVGF